MNLTKWLLATGSISLPTIGLAVYFVLAAPSQLYAACPANECEYESKCYSYGACAKNGCSVGAQMCQGAAWSYCNNSACNE